MKQKKNSGHSWTFFRSGGVDQVVFRNGEDLARLEELDQKLWMVLSMPVNGTLFDRKTAELIDADRDGHIRPPEVLGAVAWARETFVDLGLLMTPGDSVPLDAILPDPLRAGAKRLLKVLGKKGNTEITLADLSDREQFFSSTFFNGDGVIPPEAAEEEEVRSVIEAVMATQGEVGDLSGKPGVNRKTVTRFFEQLRLWSDWRETGKGTPGTLPLETLEVARTAVAPVREKIADFFARCRLASFDPRSREPLNRDAEVYAAWAAELLSADSPEIAALPLASVVPEGVLPTDTGRINPAWSGKMKTFFEAVSPLLSSPVAGGLTEEKWLELLELLAPYEKWLEGAPEGTDRWSGYPAEQLARWLSSDVEQQISILLDRDEALAPEFEQFSAVEKMVRFRTYLCELIGNFVTFSRFYTQSEAIFQAGTLYLDARACSLCLDVADPAKHAALAGLSGCYIVYCDLSRSNGESKTIAAVVTDGPSDNLMAGRNGVFYDRAGNDWDAVVTKIVSNPISVREAFWLPYKKLIRMVEEQVAKRAQAADEASQTKWGEKAAAVSAVEKAPDAKAPPHKIDLGTIALIGTAVGGVSALVGGMLQALFGLGIWLPLGLFGILMLISGPSMVLAWMKLRQRNIGPILDANGWAVNTVARLNVPFGASLTRLSALPPGSSRQIKDPYAEKRQPWGLYLLLVLVAAFAVLSKTGKLAEWFPSIFPL